MLGSEKLELGGQAIEGLLENAEVLTAAKTLSAKDTGKLFFLSLAAGFAVTLPAPKLGVSFKFVVKTAPSGGSYTVVTSGSSQILGGHVVVSTAHTDAGDFEAAATGTTVTFVDGAAVYGDMAEVFSDGSGWYVQSTATVPTGITITG